MRAFVLSLIVSALCTGTPVAQDSSAAQAYELADAYQIYSLLIPHQESYGFAKGTIIIQEQTMTNADVSRHV